MEPCAVIGCQREGKPHICPYDGSLHHHGRIHYGSPPAEMPVEFKNDGDWHLICDEHYAVVLACRKQWEREIATLRAMAE